LYLRGKVADVTYATGAFWRKAKRQFTLLRSDLSSGVDLRRLPYAAASLDGLICDPPFFRHSLTAYLHAPQMERSYGLSTAPKSHSGILELYFGAGKEALRVLRHGGYLVLKCQDEVAGGRQRFTHIELLLLIEKLGFRAVDLFVLVQKRVLPISRGNQQRFARKNHSYILVFRKPRRVRAESRVGAEISRFFDSA
jgi:tRNA G10  N-methylase Trm11